MRSASARRRRGEKRLGTRPFRRAASALGPVVAVLAFCASQASAQPPRVFSSSFGQTGSGAGQLSGPQGIAVSASTGQVYVVDRSNNRVDVFDAEGKFIETWGWGVKDGAKEFEKCTSGCLPGIAGTGRGQFKAPEAIAIDNSSSAGDASAGDVYVGANSASKAPDVMKFSATGEPLVRLPASKEEGKVNGVAVDGSGNVWLYRALEETGEIEGFSNKAANKSLEETIFPEITCAEPGFAVDAKGEGFYLNHQRQVEESCPLNLSEAPVNTAKVNRSGEAQYQAVDLENTTGVAVDLSSGELLVDNVTTVAAFSASGQLLDRFGSGNLTAGGYVAVNPTTRTVYVVEPGANKVDIFTQPASAPAVESVSSRNLTPTSAALSAQIDPNGADTHYFFQYGTAECKTNAAACTDVPAPPGNDLGSSFLPQTATVEVSGLQPSTIYYYRVLAENGDGSAEGAGSFTTLPTAAGVLADNRAWELVSPSEKHGATVEPIGAEGAPQGGLVQASESGAAITYLTNSAIGSNVEGNRPPESPQIVSTRSSSAWASQDVVTPHTKAEGVIGREPGEYRLFSNDLSAAILEPIGIEGVTSLQEPPLVPGVEKEQRDLYRRNNGSCPANCYQPLVTSTNNTGNPNFGGKLEFLGASSDANHVVLGSEVALLAGTPEEEHPNLYESNAGKAPGESGTLQLVNILPDGKLQSGTAATDIAIFGTEVGQGRSVRNAVSSDGSHVVWSTEAGNRLYLRDTATGETIQLNQVEEGSGIHEPEEEETELDQVRFQTASTDGSKVFFTDTARLTASSRLEPTEPESPRDLYECEIVVTPKLKCNLTDLTPDQNAGEAAGVQGVVLGASDNGSYAYFVANGVLASGATRGNCTETGGAGQQCNLYVYGPDPNHPGQFTTRLIAILSGEDGPTWLIGGESEPNLPRLSSRVSPSGQYLAFMSNSSLTGYNNVDANPEAKGARDEEVFLYDATANRLACASCNPSGQAPTGVFDTPQAGEGIGLLVDREQIWTGHWLAASVPGWTGLNNHKSLYQSRYVSDEGRLFFNGADPLTAPPPGAVVSRQETINGKPTQVGVENVYQYEPSGLGSCDHGAACVSLISSGTSAKESAFMDAGRTGNDTFFVTGQPLVGAEHETNLSLYDARVCTSESPCINSEEANPRPCESTDTCRPGPAPHTTFNPPPTGGSSPAEPAPKQGALPNKTVVKPLTRAQKLALALKSCRKKYKGKHKSKRRASCERQARKAFGPPKHKATHKKAKK
jgi:DNA-binding beta-propeller fold protein YncE